MPEVRNSQPDFKVFFRRLIVPGELERNLDLIQSPSQFAGLSEKKDDKTKLDAVRRAQERATTAAGFRKLAETIFADYEPKQFKQDVIEKANQVASEFLAAEVEKEENLKAIKKEIRTSKEQIANLTGDKSELILLDRKTTIQLQSDRDFYFNTRDEPVIFSQQEAAGEIPTGIKPLERERINKVFFTTLVAVKTIKNSLTDLTAVEDSVVKEMEVILGVLQSGDPESNIERDFRLRLSGDIGTMLSLRTLGSTKTTQLGDLTAFNISTPKTTDDADELVEAIKKAVSILEQQKKILEKDLELLTKSSRLRPFYEPILLHSLIGPYQVNTSLNRLGQPGTSTVSFQLPLESNGSVPDLFVGIKSSDIFSLDLLDRQKTIKSGVPISPDVLNILKPNLRETNILPFDIIQIWGRRKFSTGSAFPSDYYPMFTGFVTKTGVNYSGSSITVTITSEDVAKMLRLARVNVDPSIDPRFNPPGFRTPALSNNLSGKTGVEIIEGLILGTPGTFLGLSQVSVLESVQETRDANGKILKARDIRTRVVNLASDFDKMRLNLFADLINAWPSYPIQFKTAFRTWETDARAKFDLCREIADITEFEFYADNIGVINYHPPLYFLNPFAPQYYIENVDIHDESHNLDEAEVMTVAEVHSQAGYNLGTALSKLPALPFSSVVTASDAVIQRFGVRWGKKEVPILSAVPLPTDTGVDARVRAKNRDAARDGYARAWMNRRNAKLRSATVTINGTPEIRLCNTVAFVGDIKNTLKQVATNQLVAVASGKFLQASQALTSIRSIPPGAVAALREVLVYYVSGVTHNYVQGQRFSTTLTLTHGRHWTDPLNQGSVGYSLDAGDTDKNVTAMRAAFGQDGIDADAFARVANGMVQFMSSGDLTLLDPITDSQFGMDARKPISSKIDRFRAKLASEIRGALERLRAAACRKLLLENNPDEIEADADREGKSVAKSLKEILEKAKKAIADAFQDIKDFFAGKKNVTEKLLKNIEELAKKVIDEQKKKLEKFLNELEEKIFEALLGGESFNILSETKADVGSAAPEVILAPLRLLGIDVGDVLSFDFGIVIFIYVIKGTTGRSKTLAQAELNLSNRADELFNPSNRSQFVTLLKGVLAEDVVKKPPITKGGKGKQIDFIHGFMVIGLKPVC